MTFGLEGCSCDLWVISLSIPSLKRAFFRLFQKLASPGDHGGMDHIAVAPESTLGGANGNMGWRV
jgi:hypothetical protein